METTRTVGRRLHVICLSYLFPNGRNPGYGVFVLSRVKAVSAMCSLFVVAPVQWYPFIGRIRGQLWGEGIARVEDVHGLQVLHPRFAVIPRYLKWIDAITYSVAVLFAIWRLPRQGYVRPDIVDVHWTYPDVVAGALLKRLFGAKLVVTLRGHEAFYSEECSIRRRLVETFLRRADFVVALSAELRERAQALGVAPSKCKVILNGVEADTFGYEEQAVCRARLGLPLDRRSILSVGRLTRGKGHQDLIRMMAAISSREPDVDLYIIGGINPEDDYSGELRELIQSLALNNVHLIDGVDHAALRDWYCAADLFCLATRSEGCPNVLLEALACGTPSIVTRVGAVPDIIEDEVNGFAVPINQLGELDGFVVRALRRDWNRTGISEGMRRRDWPNCARQVMDVFQSLVSTCTMLETEAT